MNKIFKCFTMLLLLMTGTAVYAQNAIKGTVLDDTGSPLTGTSVMVEGTTTGTITDIDGNIPSMLPKEAFLSSISSVSTSRRSL